MVVNVAAAHDADEPVKQHELVVQALIGPFEADEGVGQFEGLGRRRMIGRRAVVLQFEVGVRLGKRSHPARIAGGHEMVEHKPYNDAAPRGLEQLAHEQVPARVVCQNGGLDVDAAPGIADEMHPQEQGLVAILEHQHVVIAGAIEVGVSGCGVNTPRQLVYGRTGLAGHVPGRAVQTEHQGTRQRRIPHCLFSRPGHLFQPPPFITCRRLCHSPRSQTNPDP